jgi:hypothetical protein
MSSSSKRQSKKYRKTSETEISLTLGLDGKGGAKVKTGIPFFDHMLNLFAKHGLFDLEVKAKGDLEVDMHHTVEDVGIVLGQALATALGKKEGIRRYGAAFVPMDETLARVVVEWPAVLGVAWIEPTRPGGEFSCSAGGGVFAGVVGSGWNEPTCRNSVWAGCASPDRGHFQSFGSGFAGCGQKGFPSEGRTQHQG